MKIIFTLWIIMFACVHAGLTDEAYNAYKSGNKTKAFELYSKGNKQGIVKATYNLALFYEEGIGTQKDITKARKLYKKVAYSIKDSIDYCSSSLRRYYKKTFEKLAKYEKNSKYSKRLKTLERQCRYQEYPTMDYDREFLQKCPSAKIIPKKYRREIFRLPCEYFRHYPKTMKRYMPLYAQVKKYRNKSDKKAKAAERKLRKLVYPILRKLKKREINCYKKSKTVGDQQGCGMHYIAQIDTLFITDLSTSYADATYLYGTKEDRRKESQQRQRKLTPHERAEAVRQARNELLKGDLIPEDYKLQY